ncbi:MAG: tRNA (guanosine(37)-N1)-methyltransferase TrmD [Patescibacteria group bacterium]|mgnify:FL=1
MHFDVITIFPEMFTSWLDASMMKRAREKKLVNISIHNLRDFAIGERKKVDDRPYAGGPGMVFKIEPLAKVLSKLRPVESRSSSTGLRLKKKTKIILFAPSGKQFTQKIARSFAEKEERIVMIAGHYEGVDERVKKIAKDLGLALEEFSIGPYVLTGGELPAMIMIDAVSRHIPGFLGKAESLEEKRHGIGMPVYTRPEVFEFKKKTYKVPPVLLSGDHKKVEEWKKKHI